MVRREGMNMRTDSDYMKRRKERLEEVMSSEAEVKLDIAEDTINYQISFRNPKRWFPRFYTFPPEFPSWPGVYYLLHDDEIVYVGESSDINNRLRQHGYDKTRTFDASFYLYVPGEWARKVIEQILISIYQPKYNH